ncbi:MAG: hypothetical protein N3G22_01835 [Candidatus Micrarchaeota archaeon]|nr:hypothetical protein [Candidatus Micrarchaeota archaeon]
MPSLPRLAADEMLAKLVRFMRIFGLPVRYIEGKSDEQILAMLKRTGRFLLTSDEELVRRCKKRSLQAIFVPPMPAERQVAFVLSMLKIPLPPFPASTLCPKCGGKLVRTKKERLKGKIYPAVLKRRRLFWKCAKCSHIYWSGTHYERLARAYRKIRAALSQKTSSIVAARAL